MDNTAGVMDVVETNRLEQLPLFHDVFFTIVPSPDLPNDRSLEV
jgi:hypothetical protein